MPAPHAELQTSIDREVARKVGEFNESAVQQVLSAYIKLGHVPSEQVLALLDARVRELNLGANRRQEENKKPG